MYMIALEIAVFILLGFASAEIPKLRFSTTNCPPNTTPSHLFLTETMNLECAFMPVPKDYFAGAATNSTDGRNGYTIKVERMRSKNQAAAGARLTQVIILPDGPGGSAYLNEQLALTYANISQSNPGLQPLEVLVLDHRGTGDSLNGLICDREVYIGLTQASLNRTKEALQKRLKALDDCYKSMTAKGVEPPFFALNNSAWDVRRFVDALREDNRQRNVQSRVFVHGQGFGTAWAQHFMRQAPDLVDGVILESLSPTDLSVQSFDQQPVLRENFGQDVLEDCIKDPTCKTSFPSKSSWSKKMEHLKLSPPTCSRDIVQDAMTLYARGMKRPPSSLEYPKDRLDVAFKLLFSELLGAGEPGIQLGFAIAHMAYLCNRTDVDRSLIQDAIQRIPDYISANTTPMQIEDPRVVNLVAFYQIGTLELLVDPPIGFDDNQRFEDTAELAATAGSGMAEFKDVVTRYAKYSGAFLANKEVKTARTPVLVLHGALNARFSIKAAQQQMENIQVQGSTWKTLVTVPYGAGSVANEDCAMKSIGAMLMDPSQAPSSSCSPSNETSMVRWQNAAQNVKKILEMPMPTESRSKDNSAVSVHISYLLIAVIMFMPLLM